MSRLYKNKYRTQSIRHPVWDYSRDWLYFVTICVKDFRCVFGDVKDEEMRLSEIGKIIADFWRQIPNHFEIAILDEFAVLPNHLHGIIILDSENRTVDDPAGFTISDSSIVCRDEAMPRLYSGAYPQMSKISPKPESLSVIVGSFKSICTKTINKKFTEIHFSWLPRFYDRIIRNDIELNKIRQYIRLNPAKWDFDKNHPGGIWT